MLVGTICYNTSQGIAHLARDFHYHGVIQRVFVAPHPHYKGDRDRYPEFYVKQQTSDFLDGLDILWLFETGLDWDVVKEAVRRGIKIVVMSMYEYSPWPFPVPVSLFLCPSLLDLDIYARNPQHAPCLYLPVPVDKPWHLREKALTFVHNAGHGQFEYAKGTPELIAAMEYVKSPINLLIRGQPDDSKIPRLFNRHRGNPRITFSMKNHEESELYETGDVFINAERYNGLSLPLQEAYASGMLVMTTDRYPANTWLPRAPLIPVEKYEKCHIAITFDRAVISPRTIAARIDAFYKTDISHLSQEGLKWAQEHSWDKIKPLYLQALRSIL